MLGTGQLLACAAARSAASMSTRTARRGRFLSPAGVPFPCATPRHLILCRFLGPLLCHPKRRSQVVPCHLEAVSVRLGSRPRLLGCASRRPLVFHLPPHRQARLGVKE
jgi:hypothetical protein